MLALLKGLGAGGAERLVVDAAARRSPDVRLRVAYLLPWKDALVPELEALGVDTLCLGARHSADPRWPIRLGRLLARHRPAVVHAHSPLPAIAARLLVRARPSRSRPRLVTTHHSLWSSHRSLTALADRLTAPLDDVHVAVSEAVRASMPPALRTRTEVILHGVDRAQIDARQPERAAVRDELGIGHGEVVVGTVANLRAPKAYPDLFEAARSVVATEPSVRFVTCGQGPMEDELRARLAAMELGDRFVMLGYRSDATRLMAGFDLFCLPSRQEGLPVALMEAVAMGLPVVATSVGGIPEVITDGREGRLVEPGRPDALGAAIVELASDPSLRRRMADAARERAERLDPTAATRATEDIYRRIAG